MPPPLANIKFPEVAPLIPIKKPPKFERRMFSEFVRDVKDHKVKQIELQPTTNTAFYMGEDGSFSFSKYQSSPSFWDILIQSDTIVDIDTSSSVSSELPQIFSSIFVIIGSIVILRALIGIIPGFGGGGEGGPPGFQNPFNGNGGANLELEEDILTRFGDVQGIDSAKGELEEIVDFLREPLKYEASGARIPKGALLTGKPGTGKTLLARAIAGESSVPFIQCSGSSFVEMFVGVGAKRVRDIFELARKNQPCIVFIDEIDAIGKKRSASGFASNDEREQTINQLLTEMDGFDKSSQIVVIAATNREDILDEALLRPGRFDRKITVNLADVEGREKILEVHARDKFFDETVSMRDVARQTTGFTGADLANLMNEAAIRAAKDNGGIINSSIIEDTFQRVVVGAEGGGAVSNKRKTRVAYHEAGHAIVGALMPEYDEVRKVSIISRGSAGGITFFQPASDYDDGLYTKEYLLSQIKVLLGGHAAEEIVYGRDRVSTGASSDFSQVYIIAREMVTTYGMSETLGKIGVDVNTISQQTSSHVDIEIHDIVERCYGEVLALLRCHDAILQELKDQLIEQEIVDGEAVYKLVAACEFSNCKLREILKEV